MHRNTYPAAKTLSRPLHNPVPTGNIEVIHG
jgi:hypothetical protein